MRRAREQELAMLAEEEGNAAGQGGPAPSCPLAAADLVRRLGIVQHRGGCQAGDQQRRRDQQRRALSDHLVRRASESQVERS